MRAKLHKRQFVSAFLLIIATDTFAASDVDQETIRALQERIDTLESALDAKINALADTLEQNQASGAPNHKVHIGGYGEMHYNVLDQDGEDIRQLDVHRMVLFFGYHFNERTRFVSEFEIEHMIASDGNRGAVELEQVYIEFDLQANLQLRTGAMLMPIGIINETHEPPTFYGVERPVVETTIIPTTWWSAGIAIKHTLSNIVSYDLMLSEGLKTPDPNSKPGADPFDLKAGKQKASFADAHDLAVTARSTWRPAAGLELAAYLHYQPDLDQSARESYADSAMLAGAHMIVQHQSLTHRLLLAHWDISGSAAKAAGKDIQQGAYYELDWRFLPRWGTFARHSYWSQHEDQRATQSDIGISFYPYEDIVFKADYQWQNQDAGNHDGFNLGFGYQF